MPRPLAAFVAVAIAGLAGLAAVAAHTRTANAPGIVRVDSDIDYLAPFSAGPALPPEFAGASYRVDSCEGLPPPLPGSSSDCGMVDRRASVALAVPGGTLLGGNRGEWGGELVFKPTAGAQQVLLPRNTEGIAQMPFGIVAFVGMAHGRPTGAIMLVEQTDEGYRASMLERLAGTPMDVARTDDGDLLFRTLAFLPQHEQAVFSCHLLHADRRVEDIDCLRVRSHAPRPRLRQAPPAEVAACAREMFQALAKANAATEEIRSWQSMYSNWRTEDPGDPEYFEVQKAYLEARKQLFALDEAQHRKGCSTHLDDHYPEAR